LQGASEIIPLHYKDILMKLILTLLILFSSPKTNAQPGADAIVGKWLKIPKKDMIIEVYRDNDEYKGKISWTMHHDKKKPTGFLILEKLQYNTRKQIWENGKIYDPSGGSYSATAKLDPGGKLQVLGYKGMRFLGKTKYFERVK
jgi:uncharacterized protein (DUF2147 family)